MKRRTFLFAAPAVLRAAEPPPNIVLLMADDLGSGDLSSYGCPDIRTPHIDSIGAAGVRFTRCYANAPECTPTRTALLTGRYQQRAGGLECAIGVGNVGRYDEAEWLQKRDELGLPVTETSIARMLKSAGYDTACCGKWHLGYLDRFSPNRHGFDEYFGILGGNADYFTHTEEDGTNVLYQNGRRTKRSGYLTDLIAAHAIDWLRKRTRNPFFLYVPFTAPHTPLQGPDDGPVSDPKNWNAGDRATYVKMVERMDQQVGAILEQLDRMGAARNTIVVFKSDNGGYNRSRNAPLRGGKGQLWEGGIRVPCMIRWPSVVARNWTTPQVTLSMDLTATLLAAANAKPPSGRALDGVSLLPILRREAEPFSRTVFWRYKRLENRRWAVLDGGLKYVRDNRDEALHNLATDEREQHNLLAAEPAIAERLRAKLDIWEKDVQAPRLRGFPG
jgi:N-acetylgalactosamine-6-sulfatase